MMLMPVVPNARAMRPDAENTIQVTSLNHRYLRAQEERGVLISKSNGGPLINESTGDILSPDMVAHKVQLATAAIPALRTQLESAQDAAKRSYGIRNSLLFVGFSALVASKVWSAYV